MKQTAVSWLISELKKSKDFQRVINEVNQSSTAVRDILQEAEDMEKEQIINAIDYCRDKYIDSENYYNETFKSEI